MVFMLTINYLWGLKPADQNAPVPMQAVVHNNQLPEFDYKVLGPKNVEGLANQYSTELGRLWHQIPHWVIKADLARLLWVYYEGGFYFDIDCFVQKDFTPFVPDSGVLLFLEKVCSSVDELGPLECKNPENVVRIANYAFGATQKEHPFIKRVIEECLRRLILLIDIKPVSEVSQLDVLWVCGPDVITSVYHATKQEFSRNVSLLDNGFLEHRCYGAWRDEHSE